VKPLSLETENSKNQSKGKFPSEKSALTLGVRARLLFGDWAHWLLAVAPPKICTLRLEIGRFPEGLSEKK